MKTSLNNLAMLAFFCVALGLGTKAQSFATTIGGPGNDGGNAVKEVTPLGNLIIAGYTTHGSGDQDAYLVHTTPLGQVLWSKSYGSSGTEEFHDVIEDGMGGFIASGMSNSFSAPTGTPGRFYLYIVRTDALGNVTWSKVFNTLNDHFGYGTSNTTENRIMRLIDGTYFISTMEITPDNHARRTYLNIDNQGTLLSYIREDTDDYTLATGHSIQLPNGNILSPGATWGPTTTNFGRYDANLHSFTKSPLTGIFTNNYSHTYSPTATEYADQAACDVDLYEGGLLLSGHDDDGSMAAGRPYFIQTDLDGNVKRAYAIEIPGLSANFQIGKTEVVPGAVVSMVRDFSGAASNFYLISTFGNAVNWVRSFGGTGTDIARDFCRTTVAAGYAIVGSSNSYGAGGTDIFLVKTDLGGMVKDICETPLTANIIELTTFQKSTVQTLVNSTENFTMVTTTTEVPNPTKFNVRCITDTMIPSDVPNLGNSQNSTGTGSITGTNLMLYPNPASSAFVIRNAENLENAEIKILDVMGRTLLQSVLGSSAIDISALPQGVYMYQITSNGETVKTDKIQVIR